VYEHYRQLARDLGLAMTPSDPGALTFSIELRGTVDGRPVQLTRSVGKAAFLTVRTPLLPALDLGLGLSRTGMLTGLLDLIGVEDMIIGDAAFDAEFAIRADESPRVATLLTPRLRAELFAVRARSFSLTDREFSSMHDVLDEDRQRLEQALREAIRVAQAFDEARAGLPPAAALVQHGEAWLAFAAERGLHATTSPMWMHGRLGHAVLSARAVRLGAGRFVLEVSLAFEVPLATRLEVKPVSGFSIWNPFVERTVPSGDAGFDARFAVRASEPERVPALLDPEVRRMLLELAAETERVFLNDHAVIVHARPGALDPTDIPAIFEQLEAIARAIARNAQGKPGSAYR
jgi:hypothetical protein